MADHGLQLISNPLLDETGPGKRMGNTGDLTKDNQWAQVPGTDMITGDYQLGQQTSLVRNAASVAHQGGQDRVVLETFGNSGWQVAPEFMHATVGALATRGANFTFLHAMWTDEQRVIFAPPFGPREHVLVRDAPDGRLDRPGHGDLPRQGRRRHRADPAAAGRRAEPRPRPTRATVDSDFAETGFDLERSQVDFDLLTDGALSGDPAVRIHAKVAGGTADRSGRRRTTTRCCPRPRSSTSRPAASSRTS